MEDNQDTSDIKPKAEILSYRMVGEMAPLFASLAEASLHFGEIQKNKHVKVQTRDRGSYEFDYATLEEVLRCTSPALAKQGLRLWHFLCDAPDGAKEIHHLLTHSSGAFIEAVQVIKMQDGDRWQQFGSAVTYARRYQVQCMLGVSAEDDDDGNAADGNQVVEARDRSKAPTPPKQAAKPKEAPKPKTNGESELRTQPTSDRPPPPDRQVVNDNPCSKETSSQIAKHLRALSIKGIEATNMCMSVTGKAPSELNESDGQKMLGHVQKLAEAEGVVVQ